MVISDELLYNFIANILGLTCSFILFHQQINIYEHTLFCEIGKNIDCNYVSKKNPVSKWIPAGLPIIGIYYFLFDLAYLFAIQTQNVLTLSVNLSAVLIMMALAVYQITKTLIPQHKFLQELQVSEKQSSQNTWICQKFHLS